MTRLAWRSWRGGLALWLAWLPAWFTNGAQAEVDIRIDMDQGNARMENNVRAYLSLSRYTQRDDIEDEVMERLTDRIPLEVAKALEPLGYYQSKTTFENERLKQDDTGRTRDWRVRIRITPGPAVTLDTLDLVIDGPGTDDEMLKAAREQLPLQTGEPLDQGRYDDTKKLLLRIAANRGYLEAHWTESDLLIDREHLHATAKMHLATGERYTFGAIDVQQNVIDDDVMQRLLRMQQGDPYSLDTLLQTQYVLDDTNYFRGVEVSPGTPDPETHTVPVSIIAKPNLKNRYAISAGYGTDTQARGTVTWDRRLLNRRGHRAKFSATASAVGYETSARYIMPVRDVALEKIEFTLSNIKEELADTVSYRTEFTPSFTQVMGGWQRVLFTRFSQERSVVPTQIDGGIINQTTSTFLIIPGISYATLPNYIYTGVPRRFSLSAELSGSPSSLGSGASFVQLKLQGERIFDLNPVWHLRLRGQLGASWITDKKFNELPASVRFFAGGDNSVRGYALNELSPIDPTTGKKVGARNLLVGTVEVERDLPKNLRLATFYDIGNAIDHFGDPLKDSVGVGLRWHVAVASLGLDVAKPLSDAGRGVRFHLYLSTLF